MKYLPILEELLESNSIIIFIIGIVIAILIAMKNSNYRKLRQYVFYCLGGYLVCEIIENLNVSYLVDILVLFLGTLLLGGCIGFLIKLVLVRLIK